VLAVVLPGAQGRVRRRGGRLVGRQQHRQVQVVRTAQVIAGSSRRARLDARLKYASGTPATPSSASVRQSSVLPLRGVAQIKYDSVGSTSPDVALICLPPNYLVNVY
jgi:hypothetical protein